MGFTPRQVDEMSFWEFRCCYEGYKATNGIKSKSSADISEERLHEMGIVGFE